MGNNMQNGEAAAQVLSPMEIDAVGEIMNICMGSAATAVSSMLDKLVTITTPKVSVEPLSQIDCSPLEPALLVKITYTQGVEGSNVMVFRQRDMQMIINQLMGIAAEPQDDFVLDDLSMSAACEVMNQMMGASATAMSEFLGRTVNISTPTAEIMNKGNTFISATGLHEEDNIVSILFDMNIQDVMNTQFVSVFSCNFAKAVVSQFTQPEEPAAQPAPVEAAASVQHPAAPAMSAPAAVPPVTPPVQPAAAAPQAEPQMPYPYPPAMGSAAPYMAQQGGYPMYPYPPQPYGMPQPEKTAAPSVQVQPVQFPELAPGQESGRALLGGNMNVIMNVPMNVEIVIGTTKKKIKEIMEFSQGTVIELDKQAGAPVDIMVNGQLLAHGDVVVIDDNFGVRVTEIVGTKELLNSLDKQSR